MSIYTLHKGEEEEEDDDDDDNNNHYPCQNFIMFLTPLTFHF